MRKQFLRSRLQKRGYCVQNSTEHNKTGQNDSISRFIKAFKVGQFLIFKDISLNVFVCNDSALNKKKLKKTFQNNNTVQTNK